MPTYCTKKILTLSLLSFRFFFFFYIFSGQNLRVSPWDRLPAQAQPQTLSRKWNIEQCPVCWTQRPSAHVCWPKPATRATRTACSSSNRSLGLTAPPHRALAPGPSAQNRGTNKVKQIDLANFVQLCFLV